jgi:copper chaperone CopZ
VQTAHVKVGGMSCQHCVARVKGALQRVEGLVVEAVEIGRVRVRYDPEAVGRERLTEAIEEVGFGPTSFIEG